MRLVQQATMPGSAQTDLAELFVSGLITRRDAGPGPEVDPDEVVYDFVPGVRAELLAELTRSESLRVLDDVLAKVSGRIAAAFGGTLDFRALAVALDGALAATPPAPPSAPSPHGDLAARNAGDVDGESAAPAGEAAPADARRVRRDEKVAEGRGTADADAADQAARAEATGATGDARAYAAAASAGGGAGRGGPAAEAAAAGSASAEGSAGVPGAGTAPPMRVLPEASLPFAEVAVAVLNGAGGRHRALARRLAAAVEATVTPPAPASATRPDDARLRADSSATAPVPPPAANAAPGAPSTPEPGRDVAELPAAGTRSAPEADVARAAEPVTARDAEVSRRPAAEGESAPGTGSSPAAAKGADPPDPPDPRDESNRADRTDRADRAGRADRARRGGLAGSGGGRASTPGVAYPHRLVAVPRLRVPPDREELIGRAPELARLRELSDPEAASGTRPRVVVVEGRLGMGARRLVQEYARRYGDRHSFVHWVDAGRPESLHAGLGLLAAALGPGQDPAPGPVPPRADPSAPRGDSPVVPEAWRRLTRYEGWLVVLDDLGPAYDLGAPGVLPAVGRGVVLVTTTRLYDGRGRADAVITLEPLSRAEIADHVRREVGPDLLARDERRPHVLNRLVARLSSLPGELARVDVRAEFTRELELSRRAGPSPLYRWQTGSAVLSLAGMQRDVLAVATAGRPVTVYELAGGAVTSRLLNDSGATATALAALPGRGIGTGLAVSDGGPTVELLGFPYGTRTATLRADAVPPAQGPRAQGPRAEDPRAEGAPARGPADRGPADQGPAADDRWTEAYGVPVERADGRIVTIRSSVTLLTAVPLGDGRSALAAGGPLPLRLWDAVTGAAIPTGLTERVRSIRAMAAFTGPGGDPVLAVVTRAGAAQLWDVREARRLTSPLTERLRGATSIVSVRLAGRPELLAAIDGGPMVRLWDTATGESAGELHTGGLSALVALGVLGSARGDSRLVTATADGTVQVWDLGAFVEPPDPYAAAPARDASPTSSVPAGADAEPAGTAGADRERGGAASDGVLFAAWVVHEVSGTGAMSSDVLALVLGGAALVDSAVEAGTLRREGRDRVAVAPARLPEVVAVRRGERRRTEVLVAMLTRSLPMPTSDVATWRPYDTMRPVLERLFPYLLSAEGMAAGGVGPADVLGLLTRWAWYLLLRGRYSTVASVAERVAAQVEDVLRRRGGTDRAGTADGDDGHGDSSAALTDLSAQLNRISLRARLALGDGPGVTHRARAIGAAAPHGGDDVLEGLLAEAEIAVWRGEFDAPALSAAAGLRGSPPGPPEREATAGSDDQLEQRRRLLLARAAMFRGRLGEAARWLDLARATAVRMERRAEEEARAAAELAERAAGAARPAGMAGTAGTGGTERRTADRADIPAGSPGSAASSASLADDPAFRPVWLASGAVDVLAVEYALIHAELGAAGGPGGRRLPAAAEPSFLDAPRLRLWPYTLPSPRPRHPAVIHGVGIAVPDVHLTLYLTLTQQYGLLLVRQDAVSPWDGSPRSPEDRPRAYDSARTALYEAEPHVTRQRPLMFVSHTATLGEIELAGPVPARARDHLEKARLAAEEAYGPRCPLLPRIGLLQAGALYREGAPSAAADRLRKVGDLLYDLHGDTPHQDRVALLRAWAALERDRATADRLSGTADAMAEALAAGADADAGAGRDAP
ncbi:hypothetical protein VSR01_29925 [Actinacidiphila sp. DG2A-62]|uniref:hypothetical protein n=1 Tax=Actinacidiphila sp. DG2A-62 TaxID=3108821 RepID=UPI002DBA6A50|nr:hypothetical protein [Actinacidiphila sp. DG2A-62]MEC3997491.1 hypothetical protein [Actinacidiphila sp. DG2A-62]